MASLTGVIASPAGGPYSVSYAPFDMRIRPRPDFVSPTGLRHRRRCMFERSLHFKRPSAVGRCLQEHPRCGNTRKKEPARADVPFCPGNAGSKACTSAGFDPGVLIFEIGGELPAGLRASRRLMRANAENARKSARGGPNPSPYGLLAARMLDREPHNACSLKTHVPMARSTNEFRVPSPQMLLNALQYGTCIRVPAGA